MENVDRRQFLSLVAAGGAALSRLDAAAPPQIDFPTDTRARIAVASYPFGKDLDRHKGKMTLLDFPQMVADRFGVFGIEPVDDHFASTDTEYLTRLRGSLAKAKARIVNVPVGVGGSLYDPDLKKRAQAMDKSRHWIDVAAFLDSPCVRLHLEGTRRAKTDAKTAAASLRVLGEYSAGKNVVIHLENDSPTTEDPFLLSDIIAQAGTPWVRSLPDFGNSMAARKGADFNYQAVTEMFRNAYGICHVKDALRTGKDLFSFDLDRTLRIAKDANYRGYFSMEYDSAGDPYEPTQRLIEGTLKAFS